MSTATKATPVRGASVTAPIAEIQVPPDKTDRGAIDPASIAELAASIAAVGLLQPILVTIPAKPMGLMYALVAGERRLLAAKSLGWTEIPAILIPGDVDLMRASENLQRVDLNAVEAAVVIGDLLDDQVERELQTVGYAHGTADIPAPALAAARIAAVKALAGRLGKPEQYIRDHAFMAELDSKTRKLLVDGRLPVPHARELAKVLDPDKRYEIALRAAADPRGSNRGREYAWPIADLRREVAKVYCTLGQVPWKLDVPFAGKPACCECPENSANKPGLFEGAAPVQGWSAFKEPAAGICLNRACFGAKSAAVTRAAGTAARLTISAAKPAKGKPAPPVPPAPGFVQPTKFKAAVAEKVEAAKTARKDGAGKSSVPKTMDAAQVNAHKMLEKHRVAMTNWRSNMRRRLEQALKGRQWLEVYLEAWSRQLQNKKKFPTAIAESTLAEIFALPVDDAAPKLLNRLLGEGAYIDVDWWVIHECGLFSKVADHLGVKLDPEPTPPAAPTNGKVRKGGGK